MTKIIDQSKMTEAHRRMSEQAAGLLDAEGALGIQARMVPVFQAFQVAMADEFERRSKPGDTIAAGIMTLAHCLGALLVNTVPEENQDRVLSKMLLDLYGKTKHVTAAMNADAIAEDVSVEATVN